MIAAVVTTMAPTAGAATANTRRVNLNSTGHQQLQNSNHASLSANGRYVAFSSYGTGFVSGDTNDSSDIFVRDLTTGAVTRASVSTAGAQATQGSFNPVISADGTVVAFQSYATNLVAGDTNGLPDIFVRNLTTHKTVRVSVSSAGAQANSASQEPAISGNGNVVAFTSDATNLVTAPVNYMGICCDVFARNLSTNKTILIDGMLNGHGSGDSFGPAVNGDGHLIAFGSWGCNIAPKTPCLDDSAVYVRDTSARTTREADVQPNGVRSNGCGEDAAISPDGRYVAFASDAADLVAGDTNQTYDVFVRDMSTATTTRVSVTSTGKQTNGAQGPVSMSADGRYVSFESDAWNIVSGDTNLVTDIFVRDMQTHKTTRASVSSSGGQADAFSHAAVIAANGSTIAFESDADNLVTGDTNQTTDIFTRTPPA
jgi:Tol biopolymer transport system component